MIRRLVSAAAIVAASVVALTGEATHGGLATAAAARIVAIGDIHGSFDNFVAILTKAGLIDANRRWTGGKTVFVHTGDTTDRGPGVKEALDLLMALEKQASSAGGKVLVALGNHEVMNLANDLRDVGAEAMANFGGEEGYRAAFAPNGRYGKWLRSKPLLVEVDGTVFMHAGIDLEFSTDSLDALNKRVEREIEEWDNGAQWLEDKKLIQPTARLVDIAAAARAEVERLNALAATDRSKLPPDAPKIAALLVPLANIHTSSLFHPQGPLWFRGFDTWSDEEGATRMAALLKHHRVKRFVTGHSVQKGGRINARFGGALFLIDTGMLNGKFWPSGRPSALEILPDATRPIYVE